MNKSWGETAPAVESSATPSETRSGCMNFCCKIRVMGYEFCRGQAKSFMPQTEFLGIFSSLYVQRSYSFLLYLPRRKVHVNNGQPGNCTECAGWGFSSTGYSDERITPLYPGYNNHSSYWTHWRFCLLLLQWRQSLRRSDGVGKSPALKGLVFWQPFKPKPAAHARKLLWTLFHGFKLQSPKLGFCLLKIHVHSTNHENSNARFIANISESETNSWNDIYWVINPY